MKPISKKDRYSATLLAIVMLLLSSCKGNDVNKQSSYLQLEGPVELTVPEGGITQEYTVKSNGPWEVIRKSAQTWAETRPASGAGDGTFRMIVGENKSGSDRTMRFTFLLDGEEQERDIMIVQSGSMLVWDEINQDQNLIFIRHGIPAYDATNYLYRRDGQPLFNIKMQEPSIVAVATKPEPWGYFQFPCFYRRASDGLILLTWKYSEDDVAYATPAFPENYRISSDRGKTWNTTNSPPWESMAHVMGNGEGISVRTPPAIKISESDLILPECIGTTRDSYTREYSFYRLEELPPVVQGVYLNRWNLNDGSHTRIHARLEDPRAVRHAEGDYFPVWWWGDMKLLPDNSLITGIYSMFYELETGGVDDPSGISFYRSTDHGNNWRIRGKIPYKYDASVDPNGSRRTGFGYIEPTFEVLSDGNFVCVVRTHDGFGHSPQYISWSSNQGITWTDPVPFTPNGVNPRLLLLDNGVLVLASGRPGIQLRFSFDGKGEEWTDPFEMLSWDNIARERAGVSCGYASLLPTGTNSFLIAYSDFMFLNENNEFRKAIKIREITVNKE